MEGSCWGTVGGVPSLMKSFMPPLLSTLLSHSIPSSHTPQYCNHYFHHTSLTPCLPLVLYCVHSHPFTATYYSTPQSAPHPDAIHTCPNQYLLPITTQSHPATPPIYFTPPNVHHTPPCPHLSIIPHYHHPQNPNPYPMKLSSSIPGYSILHTFLS